MGSARSKPHLKVETSHGYPSRTLAGVDEVGRGSLMGPVVAAAVVLPREISFEGCPWINSVADSKLVSREVREELAPLIEKWALGFCVAEASVEEINELNIHYASHLAMERALRGLSVQPELALIDGKFLPGNLPCPGVAIVKGDTQCLSIAAASILAKVARDRLMRSLDEEFPHFGFGDHKGYPTPRHFEALKRFGPTRLHRRNYAPVRVLL